ncbi:MAG: C25 family cysteine peptidase, partial [Myxococcota bacterium]
GDDGTGGIPLRTATAVERFTPLTGRARFTIGETGIYRLSYSAIASSTVLSAAEAAMRANEGQLRITSQGRAVPYRPDIDGVVFFADATVDEQVFGTPFVIEIGNGVRVSSLERSNPVQAPLQSFTERVLFEEDLRAAPATQSDSDDVWMWRFLLANPTESEQTSFDFDAPDITSGDAEIELRIRGGSQTVYKDHEVVVTVNGEEVHRTLFFGFDDRRETFRVPDGVLRTTGNEMTVQAIGRPDVPFSVVWVDSFELRYPRAFLAGDRERVFETAGGRVLLEGFDTPELEVWRLGRSNHDQIANPVITEEGGTYSVSFGSGSLAARYVAFTPDRARTVDALTPIGPGTGLEPGFGGVEYVVIAHPSLREGAEQLAEYRSSQGISSLVIDVFDIYDQFSDGLPRAEALGAFVRSTVSDWWIKPRYIVLVGDGSYDSRDVLAAADNLITPPLIDSPDGRFASELSLGEIFREPGYEVAVGRIPAQTPEDLAHYIAKVQVFEAAQGAVSTDAFILADNDDEAGPFSESLALAVDAFNRGAFSVDEHLVDPMDLDTARDRLFGAIESGTRYVNYIGHGS